MIFRRMAIIRIAHPGNEAERSAAVAAMGSNFTDVLPERRNRTNPRVVKQKMSSFRVKRLCHLLWPQPTKPFPEAVALLI